MLEKIKKCTVCIHYRKCKKAIFADSCEEYSVKNENEQKPAKTNKNDLNVNVNENALEASVLNDPSFSAKAERVDEAPQLEDLYSEEFMAKIPF